MRQKSKRRRPFSKASVDERLVIKNQLDKIKSEIDKTDGIINSEQAQKNRIEGSIWHGKKLYEEQYGEFIRKNLMTLRRILLPDVRKYLLLHREYRILRKN